MNSVFSFIGTGIRSITNVLRNKKHKRKSEAVDKSLVRLVAAFNLLFSKPKEP